MAMIQGVPNKHDNDTGCPSKHDNDTEVPESMTMMQGDQLIKILIQGVLRNVTILQRVPVHMIMIKGVPQKFDIATECPK